MMTIELAIVLVNFGTEFLKFLNSQPDAIKTKNWERWDLLWEPVMAPAFEAIKKARAQ